MRWRDDRGSGGMLALALLAVLAVLAVTAAGIGAVLAARQRVVAAADAGALAAADTALGFHPGVPCGVAEEVVAAHGATLASCEVDGVVATVSAAASVAGVVVTVFARAGPPPRARDPTLGS
jgi:secretion/DNA translocation related TadE-like protein